MVVWTHPEDYFYITKEGNGDFSLYVIIDRGEYLVNVSKDKEALIQETKEYEDIMFDLVERLGYDTVDFVVYPSRKEIRLFADYFTLSNKPIPLDKVERKPQVGEKFALHFDYMKENEIREEPIEVVIYSDKYQDWMLSNTPRLYSVEEIEDKADSYSLYSLSKKAYSLVK